MSKEVVAKRYAVALFQLAQEKGALEQVAEELRVVKQVFADNKELQVVLDHPKVKQGAKRVLVQEAFQGLSKDVLNTLFILLERNREDIVTEMIEHFFVIANEAQGIAEAKVYSFRALTDEEKTALADIFSKRIGKKELRIENIVDESVLGGVKLRIGNTIYDGTVAMKLDRIQRQLVSAKG